MHPVLKIPFFLFMMSQESGPAGRKFGQCRREWRYEFESASLLDMILDCAIKAPLTIC